MKQIQTTCSNVNLPQLTQTIIILFNCFENNNFNFQLWCNEFASKRVPFKSKLKSKTFYSRFIRSLVSVSESIFNSEKLKYKNLVTFDFQTFVANFKQKFNFLNFSYVISQRQKKNQKKKYFQYKVQKYSNTFVT